MPSILQKRPIATQVLSTARGLITYIPLLVPVMLFIISLSIPPTIVWDSGIGLIVLRSMLNGGPFNVLIQPDHADLAHDVATFLSLWSPGQYIAPGAFIWLGSSYGLALSITTLISILIGTVGWAQVARSFAVGRFVQIVFVSGLASFYFATFAFRNYWGGEILLFAVAPWALCLQCWAINKSPLICVVVSLFCAALLFFAKLTGLICFAANVVAISLVRVVMQRSWPTSSMLGMWAASVTCAVLFLVFWPARDWGSTPGPSYLAICFPVAATAFEGVSGLELLSSLFRYSLDLMSFDPAVTSNLALQLTGAASKILGPIGLALMIWVWFQLRDTRYRPAAIFLFGIVAIYTAAIIALHSYSSTIYFDERHLRYSGIIFFLLFLIAMDQWQIAVARKLTLFVVGVFALYGLGAFAHNTLEFIGGRYYDPLTGTSQRHTPPTVLKYLRSEIGEHEWQRPIAVVLSPAAAIALPRFRILVSDTLPKAGRTDKIFVIVQEKMPFPGVTKILLRSFRDYDFAKWNAKRIDGMIVYSQ